MRERHPDYWWWAALEILAPFWALLAVVDLQKGHLGFALACYGLATFLSIRAGMLLKRIGADAEWIAHLNDRYHKWSAFTLNGLVVLGCVAYLWRHPSQARVPAIMLAAFFTLYILSWALKIIRPHSLLARFRSVLVRVVLMTVIVGIMWKHGYWLVPIGAIPVLVASWRHLRRDQARLGWADR